MTWGGGSEMVPHTQFSSLYWEMPEARWAERSPHIAHCTVLPSRVPELSRSPPPTGMSRDRFWDLGTDNSPPALTLSHEE